MVRNGSRCLRSLAILAWAVLVLAIARGTAAAAPSPGSPTLPPGGKVDEGRGCYTMENLNRLFAEDPDLRKRMAEIEADLQSRLGGGSQLAVGPRVIPVV